MKRICSQNERELLLKNRNQLLKGIYQTKAKSKWGHMVVGLLFSFVIMFLGIFPVAKLFDGAEAAMWAWIAFSLFVPSSIVTAIMGKLQVKKETKAFLKKETLAVNGATIVLVDREKKIFSYIEDDFVDANGIPIIIDYPALPAGFSEAQVGQRMIVMYDGDNSFQLMQMNEALVGLIPAYTEQYPLQRAIYEHWRVPHPNAAYADFIGHPLTEEEKKYYTEKRLQNLQKDGLKTQVIAGIVFVIAVMLLAVILGLSEDCLPKALGIGAIVCVGFIFFVLLCRKIGKNNILKQSQFVHVQEVLFHSNVIDRYGKYVSTELKVYEWKTNQFELVSYPQQTMPANTPYGCVLQKFTTVKGKTVLSVKL